MTSPARLVGLRISSMTSARTPPLADDPLAALGLGLGRGRGQGEQQQGEEAALVAGGGAAGGGGGDGGGRVRAAGMVAAAASAFAAGAAGRTRWVGRVSGFGVEGLEWPMGVWPWGPQLQVNPRGRRPRPRRAARNAGV